MKSRSQRSWKTVKVAISPLLIAAMVWFFMWNRADPQANADPVISGAPLAAVDLPALKQNDIVLFQGDSITDGGRQRSGMDYNHIMGQCYAYILAAQLGAMYPERNLTFINRGIDGNSVVDLSHRWKTDTLDLKPNVLTILVGVNDSVFLEPQKESFEQYEQVYDKLLADTVAALPGVKIVLCEPFLLPVGNTHHWPPLDDPATFSAKMDVMKKHQAAVARLARKYNCPEVRLQSAFDDACKRAPANFWTWDGIHPTYAGHGLMVEEWKRAVNAFWPRG